VDFNKGVGHSSITLNSSWVVRLQTNFGLKLPAHKIRLQVLRADADETQQMEIMWQKASNNELGQKKELHTAAKQSVFWTPNCLAYHKTYDSSDGEKNSGTKVKFKRAVQWSTFKKPCKSAKLPWHCNIKLSFWSFSIFLSFFVFAASTSVFSFRK